MRESDGPSAQPGDEVVRIESVAAGGDGVGRLADGMAVFVPRAAPGDRVRIRRIQRRRRHAHAALTGVVEPGPDRIEPKCAHFVRDACGGCQWQHLSVVAQREAKRRIVGDALRRIGRLAVEDPDLVPSGRSFGYRATITLTVRWTSAGPVVGFHSGAWEAEGQAGGRASGSGAVFALERCEIAREEIGALWAALRPAVGALPKGDDVRLKLRVAHDGALHVIVGGGEGAWTTPQPLADAAAAAGRPATVWWQPVRGTVRRLAGPIADRSAVAFEQVNADVAAALRAAVVEAVPATARRVLDLYAGTGEIALALAGRGHQIVSVEVEEAAVRRASERAQRDRLAVEALVGRVEDMIGRLLPADVVVANPPRTGLAPAVSAALAAHAPQRLVYVSCDPATLARDLRRLGAEPSRLALTCFDMFPQTSHVETLAVLARA